MHSHRLKIVGTLVLALAAARLCVWLGTPIPWMIGPLLATAAMSMCGAPTASHHRLRNAGQWVIGAALGLYFTPEVGRLVASLWWAVALGIAWALWLGWLFGAWLARVHGGRLAGLSPECLRATTYFSGSIGAASEMTLLAERAGARTDLVAAAHSLRVLMVTLTVPLAMQAWGGSGLELSAAPARQVELWGLLLLAVCTGVGGWVARLLRRANPWFMGALFVSIGITLAGQNWSALPTWLTNAAQMVIGVSLGVRFRPVFLHTAPRWLVSVALATLLMMAVCAAFAWALSTWTGLHPATLVLATSPGGIAEMSITAKVLQLGVPVVIAFQACRLVAVLMLVVPMYRWLEARQSA